MKRRHSNSRICAGSGHALAFTLTVSALITGSQAATRLKQDNAAALNVASSWDILPGAADIAQWESAVTAANCPAVLGANLTWAGIKIVDPGDAVTLSGANTLTLGKLGIDLSTATQNLTIASDLTVLGKQSWSAAASRTLDVTGSFTRNGATVDFTNFNASAMLGTLANDPSGILGPWATSGVTTALQYVTSTAGVISAYTGATPAAPADLSDVTSDSTNYTYAAATTLVANQSGNTLRYTGGTATTALGTKGLTLNGLMHAGTGTLTLTSTAGNPGLVIGASGELDIISNDRTLTLSTKITETSPGKVVYSGAGPITFGTGSSGNANSYTGGTVINSTSQFTIVGVGSWFGTGPVTFNGGSMVFSNNTLANDFTFNGGLATLNTSSALSGTITLAVPTTFQLNTNGNMVISGKVTGPGGLTKTQGTNNGPLQLTHAANDYAGLTTVAAGILQVQSSLYGNDTSQWTPENISVTSGATFALNIGGTNDFSSTAAGTMLTNLLTVNNNGLKAGAIFGLSTANASATPVTFATPITNSVGTGGGAVGLRKLGANTLELTGDNTYSGKTRIDAGTLSINNIANIGATSSALGAPSAANEAISIGHIAVGGILHYTGAEQSTDRTIQIGTNSPGGAAIGDTGGATLQNDGEGMLTFSAASFNTQTDATSGVGASRTLTLQGSNNGTISGIIQNNLVTSPATGSALVALVKSGTGTWTLDGANSYSNATRVAEGALSINTINNVSGGASSLGAPTSTTTGKITLGSTATTGTLIYTGAAKSTNRQIQIGSNSATPAATDTGGAMIQADGGGALTFSATTFNGQTNATSGVGADRTLTLQGSNTEANTIAGAIKNNAISGTATGTATLALTKSGAGTWVLRGVNTYTGPTQVTEGTLALVGGSQTSPITVDNLASLGFIPGSSTTSTKSVSFTAGSTVKIIETPTPATPYTLLTTTATISGTPVLDPPLAGFELLVEGSNVLKLMPTTAGGYSSWQTANGTTQAIGLDHDDDGVSNGIEFFLGGTTATTGFTPLPGVTKAPNGTLSVTWTKAATYTGTYGPDFVVQTSATLNGDWMTEPSGVNVTFPSASEVKYTFPAGTTNFARLKVTGP